jgi:hypothetical protein
MCRTRGRSWPGCGCDASDRMEGYRECEVAYPYTFGDHALISFERRPSSFVMVMRFDEPVGLPAAGTFRMSLASTSKANLDLRYTARRRGDTEEELDLNGEVVVLRTRALAL